MTFKQLQEKVLSWAKDKDLLHTENVYKQFMKFIEEVFEFKTEFDFVDYNLNIDDHTFYDMKLEMGDIFVTLIILCEQIGIDPVECLSMAYEKISKRKGKPIEDREEEKKFYLRHKHLRSNGGSIEYFTIWISQKFPLLKYKTFSDGFKQQFTLKEIQELKEKFDTDLADFELVEVEDGE